MFFVMFSHLDKFELNWMGENILISKSGLMDKKFGNLWRGLWELDGNEILWICMMWVGDALCKFLAS